MPVEVSGDLMSHNCDVDCGCVATTPRSASYFTPARASSARSRMSSFFTSAIHGFSPATGRATCCTALAIVTH